MIKKNNYYIVELPVKNYVYRWLMRKFHVNVKGVNDTVSFARSFEMNMVMEAILLKNSTTYDYQNDGQDEYRKKKVNICIGEKMFFHEGNEITHTSAMRFTKHLERIVRADFLAYAHFMYMVEPQLQHIIERYKELNGYTEEDWPTESMIKICTRAKLFERRKEAREHFVKQAESFFVTQLSSLPDIKKVKYLPNETSI